MNNLGIGGETTEGLAKRVLTETSVRSFSDRTAIFFAYGANDLAILDGAHQVPAQKFKANLEYALDIIKKFTGNIYLLNILPISDKIDGIRLASGKIRHSCDVTAYNSILDEVSGLHSVPLIDVYAVFYPQKEFLLSRDGLHPNEYGYSKLADHIKPVISNMHNDATLDFRGEIFSKTAGYRL